MTWNLVSEQGGECIQGSKKSEDWTVLIKWLSKLSNLKFGLRADYMISQMRKSVNDFS